METAERILRLFGYGDSDNEIEMAVRAARREQLLDILREYGKDEYEHGYWQARESWQDWR